MHKLIDVVKSPSGFDSLANYIGELPSSDMYCLMTQNRDSGVLTRANWQAAIERLGGESENVQIDRFGHWACGWWESLSVKAGTPQYNIATEIEADLAKYPVLDECLFSEMEQTEADSIWENCYTPTERVEYIRSNRSQFDFRDFAGLLACVRGKYFAGYASELITE